MLFHQSTIQHQRELLISAIVLLLVFMQVSYFVSAYAAVDVDLLDTALDNSYRMDFPSPDKRYARLSYSYGSQGSRGGRRNRYYNSRYYRSRYYRNYYKPWLNLPDTECFRQRCSRDTDCCRRYSKCDRSAKICYNCWYGHPCRTSRDCCERFPHCNRKSRMCQT